jgi:hypothetical protein
LHALNPIPQLYKLHRDKRRKKKKKKVKEELFFLLNNMFHLFVIITANHPYMYIKIIATFFGKLPPTTSMLLTGPYQGSN